VAFGGGGLLLPVCFSLPFGIAFFPELRHEFIVATGGENGALLPFDFRVQPGQGFFQLQDGLARAGLAETEFGQTLTGQGGAGREGFARLGEGIDQDLPLGLQMVTVGQE
jgi:hypothetical protein